MRFLFVKESLVWPRSSGHDVHTFYLMQALAKLGHSISLATLREPEPKAIDGGGLESIHTLKGEAGDAPLNLTKWQEKFRSYWGIRPEIIREVGSLSKSLNADAVVVVGLNVLPYLGAVQGAKRIWYAGDEWVWHHFSQLKMLKRSTWGEAKQALVKGMYERAYASLTDRVWMVSEADRKALRWVTGQRGVDVLPNGIDSDYYHPGDEPQTPRSCVFWGRLDFGPNIQALEWFCNKVWPEVRKSQPDAVFSIYGFQPTDPVMKLVSPEQGIRLTANLPDLRSEIRRHAVVVLPFVSGGGIKNKLLEAAAMGKAILCTPRTDRELSAGNAFMRAKTPSDWVQSLRLLWEDEALRTKTGEAARRWVTEHHTWEAAARIALGGIG